MKHILLEPQQAFELLNTEDFLTKHNLTEYKLWEELGKYKTVGTMDEGGFVSFILFRQVGQREVEAHGYFYPEHKCRSIEGMYAYFDLFKMLGIEKIVTVATPIVLNFLVKRGGFVIEGNDLVKYLGETNE